jgi:TPR repeat protein
MVFAFAPVEARAAELRTKVADVLQGGRIKLTLPAGHAVRVGDLVAISGNIPGFGRVTLETRWRIDTIGDGFATAAPVGAASGLPGKGFVAVIVTASEPTAAQHGLLGSYRNQAEGGDVEAMVLLAMHYFGRVPLTDPPAKPDPAEAVRWLEKAAARKSATAACELGSYYRDINNRPEAVRWTRQAAEGGDALCMFNYAIMLSDGYGVEKNDKEAFAWMKKASAAGDLGATFELAQFHLFGIGAQRDLKQALALLLPLAEKGDPSAMLYVVAVFSALQQQQESLTWLRKAAAAGHPLAMYQLGAVYWQGTGVAKNERESRGWFARAAALGHAESMFWLAGMYEFGHGGERNSKEAARFAMLALQARSIEADKLLRHAKDWSPAFWRELQARLKAAGVYKGAVDGRFNPDTVRAIEAIIKEGA